MKEKSNNGKEILKLYKKIMNEIEHNVSSAWKNMFKDALQEMMNVEFDNSIGYSKYDNTIEKNKL